LEEFQPLSPGPTVTSYFVKARLEHTDTIGIYLYDFESGEYLERIYINDSFDVAGAIFRPETREPLGFYYFEDKVVFESQDNRIQAHLGDLNERFGNASIFPLQASSDGSRLLLQVTGPQDPGSYHVYDAETGAVHRIADIHNELASRALAPVKAVKYVARDGLALTGYLTRPNGAGDRGKPPLIVLPHGGPESRDTLSFHPLAQLFAASGYQVFQPNFRGSAGYGRRFTELGHGEFGRAMQTDIDDGFAHLVDNGLADPDRACIVGTSYGGYAALAAATLTPDLYQCAVSQAGISDLVRQLKDLGKREGTGSEVYKYWVRRVGDPKKDRARLEAVSPARLVDRVTVPVLLIHGLFDNVVPKEQSEIMQERLSAAGKDVELMLVPIGHHLDDHHPLPEVYEKIRGFLQEHTHRLLDPQAFDCALDRVRLRFGGGSIRVGSQALEPHIWSS
jgi:dipeptidyl aminopeptidase/acylaminoacyl peptidase